MSTSHRTASNANAVVSSGCTSCTVCISHIVKTPYQTRRSERTMPRTRCPWRRCSKRNIEISNGRFPEHVATHLWNPPSQRRLNWAVSQRQTAWWATPIPDRFSDSHAPIRCRVSMGSAVDRYRLSRNSADRCCWYAPEWMRQCRCHAFPSM